MPEIAGRSDKFEPDLTSAVVFLVDVSDATGLLFAAFGISDDQCLADPDLHGEMDEAAVGADYGGVRILRERLFVLTDGYNQNGHSQQDALAAAAIAHGCEVR